MKIKIKKNKKKLRRNFSQLFFAILLESTLQVFIFYGSLDYEFLYFIEPGFDLYKTRNAQIQRRWGKFFKLIYTYIRFEKRRV